MLSSEKRYVNLLLTTFSKFICCSLFLIFPCLGTAQNLQNINPELLPPVEWNISSQAPQMDFVYTPFVFDNSQIIFFSGGSGVNPKNGVLKLVFDPKNNQLISKKAVIQNGPDINNYNYFRAPRVSQYGNELWMLVEVSGCYSGCDSSLFPKSLAVYRSSDKGESWSFLDFVKLNGHRYIATWFGHTGLIHNAQGPSTIDFNDLTSNRFITVGENRDIMVSADGVNFYSIPMQHSLDKDRLVFASIAKTPFGFHLMTCSNWSDLYYTTTIRHLFSKDLINWFPIEPNSYLKNTQFYKGVHLSYDSIHGKLWAYSPCGVSNGCNILASLEPKDYFVEDQQHLNLPYIPIGEPVIYNSQQGLITARRKLGNRYIYSVKALNGVGASDIRSEDLQRPLLNYQKFGCIKDKNAKHCIGDSISYGTKYGSILGFFQSNGSAIKYAIRFNDGVVDTGYTESLLTFF